MSNAFQTPVIWTPNQEAGETQQQIDDAMFRAYATAEWEAGKLETDIFLDILDSHKIDVFDLVNLWDKGIVL